MARKGTAITEHTERTGRPEDSESGGKGTYKLSVVVSRLTHDRLLSALQRDRDYRGKGVYFLQDAVENELIRSEARANGSQIGLDKRISGAKYDIPGAEKLNLELNGSKPAEEKF